MLDSLGAAIEIVFPFAGVAFVGMKPLQRLFNRWKAAFLAIEGPNKRTEVIKVSAKGVFL